MNVALYWEAYNLQIVRFRLRYLINHQMRLLLYHFSFINLNFQRSVFQKAKLIASKNGENLTERLRIWQEKSWTPVCICIIHPYRCYHYHAITVKFASSYSHTGYCSADSITLLVTVPTHIKADIPIQFSAFIAFLLFFMSDYLNNILMKRNGLPKKRELGRRKIHKNSREIW